MNQIRSINTRRVIIVLIMLLLVSTVFFFWLRDVVREVIVLPLSYLLFVAGIIIDTTPQLFFWLSLLLITFWIAYRSLATRRKRTPPPVRPVLDETNGRQPFSGRVANWAVKVTQMRRYNSIYYRGTFHQSLARLLIDLLAHRYHLTPLQAEDRLRRGVLEVPPDVREYTLTSLGRMESTRLGFLARIWKMLKDKYKVVFVGRFGISSADEKVDGVQTDSQIARIIHYMEEELEVSHDHPSQ